MNFKENHWVNTKNNRKQQQKQEKIEGSNIVESIWCQRQTKLAKNEILTGI